MAGEHAMSEKQAWIPAQRSAPENDATMVLPIYDTASAPARSQAPVLEKTPAPAPPVKREKPRKPDALPSDERNMLIFVSMLLLMGTLAIVAMASIGR
jgi:hypothetical protein